MLEAAGEMEFQHTHDPVAVHVGLERADQLSNHRRRRNVDEEDTCEYSNVRVCNLRFAVSGLRKVRVKVQTLLSRKREILIECQ